MVWFTKRNRWTPHDNTFVGCALKCQYAADKTSSFLEHSCALDVFSEPAITRLTGIICKIGAACLNVVTLVKMIEKGMDIACLNFSHGNHDFHAEAIENIRTATEHCSKKNAIITPIGIALETRGPLIRTGFPIEGRCVQIELKEGQIVKLITDVEYVEKETPEIIFVDYEDIDKDVTIGMRILIDDGRIILVCTLVEEGCLTCLIEKGGFIGSKRHIRIPGAVLNLPTLTSKDRLDLEFGLNQGIDIVFASFIRTAAAVKEVREALGPRGKDVVIMAKIENEQGLRNINSIIEEADGIVLSRYALGIDMPLEEVFLIQKSVAARCNQKGKPIICAAHLLESMKKISRPTRAEVEDVANAILDGVDCLMLCNETSRGDYPIESVFMVAKICKEAEASLWHKDIFSTTFWKESTPIDLAHAVAISATGVSLTSHAAAIVVVSNSMKSAKIVSSCRPKCPIIAVTRNIVAARQAHLCRGILPLVYKEERESSWSKDVLNRLYYGINFGRTQGFIKPGDQIITLAASKQGAGFTDQMRVFDLPLNLSQGIECQCYI